MSNLYFNLAITFAKTVPQELLVELLEKGLQEYKAAMLIAKSEDEEKKIFKGALDMPCFLILLKICGPTDPMEMLKDIEKMEIVSKLIHPNKN